MSEERKELIAKAMTYGYTSLNESDMSEDDDGNPVFKAYLVKNLSWEKTVLKNICQERPGPGVFKKADAQGKG